MYIVFLSTSNLCSTCCLQMQGCWNQWDNIMNTDFSWNKLIYGTSDGVLRFLLNSTTNTLPTPDNLRRWGVSRVELSCVLCHRVSTLRHILTGCPVALHQGRYTWRHNSVLSVIQQSIITSWNAQKDVYANTLSLPYIEFVKPGLKPSKGHPRKQLLGSLLSGSLDWVFLFDLEESLIFPSEIAFTTLRPDGVIFSHKLKTVTLLELTVPIEDRVITAKFIKSKRYDSLIRECQSNGWKAILLTLEIGCRGYINNNVLRVLQQLGLSRSECRSTLKSCSQVALHCSYVIYLNRNKAIWHTMPYISRLE